MAADPRAIAEGISAGLLYSADAYVDLAEAYLGILRSGARGSASVVVTDSPMMILGGYSRPGPALSHARTITGASVVTVQILDRLPDAVMDLLNEDFEDDEDTPVTDVLLPDIDGA